MNHADSNHTYETLFDEVNDLWGCIFSEFLLINQTVLKFDEKNDSCQLQFKMKNRNFVREEYNLTYIST